MNKPSPAPAPEFLPADTTHPLASSGKGQPTVAALNALQPPDLAWAERRALMDMTDICGASIKTGERYFRREVFSSGNRRKEYDTLALPSMILHLKMTFGRQVWFLANCKHSAKTRETARLGELRSMLERSAAEHGQGQP
jgi:hypothetical protein